MKPFDRACQSLRPSRRLLLSLGVLTALSACQYSDGQVHLGFSSYSDSPVVLTDMTINGKTMPLVPMVVTGRAETVAGRTTGSGMLMAYPAGKRGSLALTMSWVDLPTGRAWHAVVDVPLSELERPTSGGVALMPVFGPGGLLLMTSDPMPRGANDYPARDVVRLCARRNPGADKDFSLDPTALPALAEALASMVRGPVPASCI